MAFQATLAQLTEVLSATPIHLSRSDLEQQVSGISTDTRQLKPGEIFLALRGENFDGHQFLEAAKQQGAIAVITESDSAVTDMPQLRVPDTLGAYQTIGRWWRSQFAIPIVAITGSVGKTTTKELMAAALSHYGTVLKTRANYNNEVGVPKTLLELGAHHDYAVVEMGMRGPGEIACLAQIAQPDIAVITNVGTAHIGRLGSRAAIAEAKCELLAALTPTSAAVLNADNPLLLKTASRVWSGTTLTYGLEAGDLRGHFQDDSTLHLQAEDLQLPVPLPGAHNALNYLAVLAVLKLLHLDLTPLKTGYQVDLPVGRAQQHYLANDIVLLDQSYNAGPESVAAALHLLVQTPGKRWIAVLGAMKELGEHGVNLHRQIGTLAARLAVDHLLILGTGTEETAIAQGYEQNRATPAPQFATHTALVAHLRTHLQPGDRVLFKASHSVDLRQVVTALQNL